MAFPHLRHSGALRNVRPPHLQHSHSGMRLRMRPDAPSLASLRASCW